MDSPGESKYNFDAAEIDYRAGGMSLRAVAAKHGIPEATLRRYARANGWIKGASEEKRELVNEAMAGEDIRIDAEVTQELTQMEVRQKRIDEAMQDVQDMNKGLSVARKVMDKLLLMVDGCNDATDIKRIIEANKAAVETIRKIRALDADPEPPEANVVNIMDDGFSALRQAFKDRLAKMGASDAGA